MSGIHVLHRDADVRKAAEEPLAQIGFRVRTSASLAGGVPAGSSDMPDLVLLEWLGAERVLDVLRNLNGTARPDGPRVIVVTDQVTREDAAQAWDFGIEDCLIHPFGSAELIGRVRAVLGRPARIKGEHVAAGPVVLDKASHQVLVGEQPLDLAPTEFRLLRFLLENQSRVFSRQELLERAWGGNVQVGPRTVDVHVRRLRQLLEPFACEGILQTVRGFGYRLTPLPRSPETNRDRSANGRELS